MNNTNIIGRIGKEIELKYLSSGSAVASFSIAVDQSYKNKDTGQKVEKTSWIDIKAIGVNAENVNKFFHKGSMIGIEGELEQESWKAQDGSNRSKIVVKLKKFTFIDKRTDSLQQAPQNNYNQPQQNYQQPQQSYQQQAPKHTDYQPRQQPRQMPQQPPTLDMDEDLPF